VKFPPMLTGKERTKLNEGGLYVFNSLKICSFPSNSSARRGHSLKIAKRSEKRGVERRNGQASKVKRNEHLYH